MTGLTGHYYVKRIRSAVFDMIALLDSPADRIELKQHLLKLRFWPSGCDQEPWPTHVEDLDWRWIDGVGDSVGRISISDEIGGRNNLTAVFFVSKVAIDDDPLPRIWILAVMEFPQDGFSRNDIEMIRSRLAMVQRRYYSDDDQCNDADDDC